MFRASKQQGRSKKSTTRIRCVESLEQRLALSVYGLPGVAAPMGCCCPGCTGASSFVLAGQESSSAYTAPGYKWSQSSPGAPATITYSYSNLLGGLGGGLAASTIKAAIQEALGRWAAVAPLNFVEQTDSGPAPTATDYSSVGNPQLRFGHRAIDGAYNVLAYGYYPGGSGLAGDVQFDSNENWTVHPGAGIDLLEVATHEIGHALGLAHEPMPSSGGQQAIMNPIYAGRFGGLGTSFLYTDDINGIRALYGAGTGSVTPQGSTPPAPTGLEATLTGPSTVIFNGAGAVTFTNTASGQRYSYDFNNDGSWEVGNGTYAGSTTTSSTSIPSSLLSTPRQLIVRGRVIRSDGQFRDTFVSINVTGNPPTVSLPGGGAMDLTSRLVVGGSFTDPGSTSWRVTVDYGDGTGVQQVSRNGSSFTLNHSYTNAGNYTVTAWVTDETGAIGSAQMQVTVVPVSSEVQLVRNLFHSVLGRPADPGAEASLGNALRQGVPVSAIVAAVWNSDEARGRRLNEYYQQIMGRNIDAGGLASWLANMRNGMPDEEVIKALVASPEFINANPANADYVRVVFRFVLGRNVDPSGLASWSGHLDRGMTRADLVRTVMQSGECQANLMNKYFQAYLGRAVTQGDLNAWRPGSNPGLTTANLATAILQSQEFRNRHWWL